MATQTELQLITLFNKGVSKAVDLWLKNQSPAAAKYTRDVNMDVQSYLVAGVGNFPGLVPTNPGTALFPMDVTNPFNRFYTAIKYTGINRIDNDMNFTNINQIIQKVAPMFARSGLVTKETVAASFFNLATSTGLLCPDGLPVASASHIIAGGTQSNLLSAATISNTSAELAVATARTLVDHAGNPFGYMGGFRLLTTMQGQGLASRLVQTTRGTIGSNNNDKNWIAGEITDVVATPYFSQVGGVNPWMLVPDDDMYNPLTILVKRALRVIQGINEETDSSFRTAVTSLGACPIDYRPVVYNPGA